MKRIQGFSVVEILIAVAVVAIVGALAYVAWNNFAGNDEPAVSETATSDTQEPAKIESESDLDDALNTIDSTSVDDDDATEAQNEARL